MEIHCTHPQLKLFMKYFIHGRAFGGFRFLCHYKVFFKEEDTTLTSFNSPFKVYQISLTFDNPQSSHSSLVNKQLIGYHGNAAILGYVNVSVCVWFWWCTSAIVRLSTAKRSLPWRRINSINFCAFFRFSVICCLTVDGIFLLIF